MKDRFAFLILAYNQENYIQQTLNSIKYQVENYGKNVRVRLVIGDDCSADSTVKVAKRWIQDNIHIFEQAYVIEHSKNVGTVENFVSLMDELEIGEAFAVLAADDLFSNENVIGTITEMKDDVILSFPYIQLIGDTVSYNTKYLRNYFYKVNTYNKKKNIRRFMMGNYLHSPSTFYSKKIFDESKCRNIVGKYRLFEDDPSMYEILKHCNGGNIAFGETPLVIYRTEVGVSNSPNVTFEKDYETLQNQYISDARGLMKMYCNMKKGHRKKITFLKIINKLFKIRDYIYAEIILRKQYTSFKQKVAQCVRENQFFYETMKDY